MGEVCTYAICLCVQHICDCAVYYVGKVYTRVTDEDIYKNGKFHASEKVYIHIRTDTTQCGIDNGTCTYVYIHVRTLLSVYMQLEHTAVYNTEQHVSPATSTRGPE